jgi:hypothetical protein
MARKKERGNGDGDVWPRKNKEGKIIGYRGAYFGPDGKRHAGISAKRRPTRIRDSSSTPRT